MPLSKLNNWIDRNRLWQTDRGIHFHRSYTIGEIFDLAGFAQLRLAGIPERRCAVFVYNYGFYRHFLHLGADGTQFARFSMKNGDWQLGVYEVDAVLTLSVNMRELGLGIFERIAKEIKKKPSEWPEDSFENFACLYRKAVKLNRLSAGSIPEFEAEEDSHDPHR